MAISGDYISTYTGEQVDEKLALAGTSLQQGIIKQTTGVSTTDLMSQNAISTNLYTLSDKIDDLIDGTTTIDKATNADLATYAYGANFDKIISTQAEFETLIASETWLGAKSVLFNGKNGEFTLSTADNSGIKIPATVFTIMGINNATITITNFLYNAEIANAAGLWYETLPTTSYYSITNLTVNCTGSGTRVFCNCTQLTNCVGSSIGFVNFAKVYYNCTKLNKCDGYLSGESSSSNEIFRSCEELINCYGEALSNTYSLCYFGCKQLTGCIGITNYTGENHPFYGCSQLTNCIGTAVGASSSSVGAFYACSQLTNCIGTAVGTSSSRIYAFDSCRQLINCTGMATATTGTAAGFGGLSVNESKQLTNCRGSGVSDSGSGYGFYNCSYASCCTAGETVSTTALWGGTTTKRDDDSCQTS